LLNLAEAEAAAAKLESAFTEVYIDGTRDKPIVVAKGHKREWSPQRVLFARYGGHRQVVLMNPNTRAARL
jgi:hypothetical protein